MSQHLLLAFAILAEVIATSALKSSEGFTRLVPSVLVILGYGMAFYFLSLVLKPIPIGVAYAIWSGLGIVLISLVGWLLFGKKLDLWGAVGMAMIVGGVVVLNLLSEAG